VEALDEQEAFSVEQIVGVLKQAEVEAHVAKALFSVDDLFRHHSAGWEMGMNLIDKLGKTTKLMVQDSG
jgi:hypothetical protein